MYKQRETKNMSNHFVSFCPHMHVNESVWVLHGCLMEQHSTKCNLLSGSEMPVTTTAKLR